MNCEFKSKLSLRFINPLKCNSIYFCAKSQIKLITEKKLFIIVPIIFEYLSNLTSDRQLSNFVETVIRI